MRIETLAGEINIASHPLALPDRGGITRSSLTLSLYLDWFITRLLRDSSRCIRSTSNLAPESTVSVGAMVEEHF